VTWSLDLAGGTQLTRVDLRGGKVAGIAVMAGSDTLDMRLPRPAGTLPLLLDGGVSQFLLSLPAGVPAQVTVGGGASFLSLDGQHLTGIAGGTVVTSPGWAGATSRYDIDAISGFSRLAVSRPGWGGSWARDAEEAGFSTLGTIGRLVYPNYEELISLAAAAAVTSRIRLTTSVLLAPLYANTALFAKQAASLDRLSGGRLVLGLGLGGREDDYTASALPTAG